MRWGSAFFLAITHSGKGMFRLVFVFLLPPHRPIFVMFIYKNRLIFVLTTGGMFFKIGCGQNKGDKHGLFATENGRPAS